jgi:hypothetical protein
MTKSMQARKSQAKQKSVSIRHGLYNKLVTYQSFRHLKREIRLAHSKAQKDFCFSLNKTILLLEQKLSTMKMIVKRVFFLPTMRVE